MNIEELRLEQLQEIRSIIADEKLKREENQKKWDPKVYPALLKFIALSRIYRKSIGQSSKPKFSEMMAYLIEAFKVPNGGEMEAAFRERFLEACGLPHWDKAHKLWLALSDLERALDGSSMADDLGEISKELEVSK